MSLLVVGILSCVVSFIFALGGVGGAVALVPILGMLGVPVLTAKPIGLFSNTLSMGGASFDNIRNKRVDFRIGTPIIVTSMVFAPLGVYLSHHLSARISLSVFVVFLVFSSVMLLFFRGARYADQYRSDRPVFLPGVIGALAGTLSGLLGVGGGGLISPLMIFLGFNPKQVAGITAFAVPFSSLVGFVAYAAAGSLQWSTLLVAGAASWVGGVAGTKFMQGRLQPGTVKRILAVILLVLAVKLALKLAGMMG